MSTRATPASNVVTSCPSDDQLVVGLRPPLLEREPRVLARPLEQGRVELDRDPCVPGADLRPREHRAVGREDVRAADVRAVPVEPGEVGEDREHAVVAREEIVEARRPRSVVEQLPLGAQHPPLRQLTLAPSNVSSPPPAGIVRFACGSRTTSAPLSARMRQLSKKSLSWQIAVPTLQKPRSTTFHSYACRKRKNSS